MVKKASNLTLIVQFTTVTNLNNKIKYCDKIKKRKEQESREVQNPEIFSSKVCDRKRRDIKRTQHSATTSSFAFKF